MAAHSSILAWRIPWTEEPGGLQSMGSNRLSNWATNTYANFKEATVFNGWISEGLGLWGQVIAVTASLVEHAGRKQECKNVQQINVNDQTITDYIMGN